LLRKLTPPQLIVISFALVILLGAFLLMLPPAANGAPVAFIDALFTSASAVCVTGLIVVDTGTKFTLTGQLIILVLIQLGGLGIMTYSVVFVLLMGRKLAFREKLLISDTFSQIPVENLGSLVKRIFLFTFIIEGSGALLLFCRWLWDFPWPRAAYLAVFHAVSAFCNAGFSPFSDSLMGYRADLTVNLVIMGLIVCGGIGFLVLNELPVYVQAKLKGQHIRLSLHSKLVLSVTTALIVAGALLIFLAERHNTLRLLPYGEGMMAAFFQSVTARTAGFNTLDISSFGNASLMVVILLMFIGASPGSCGGGVKTTAFGVFILTSWARLTGRDETSFYGRTLPDSTVLNAFTIVTAAIVVLFVFMLLLSVADAGLHLPLAQERCRFLGMFFEEVSAFATVGLSAGITATLSVFGKILIIMLMFIGRVGPLTVLVFIIRRKSRRSFRYAEEQVMIG